MALANKMQEPLTAVWQDLGFGLKLKLILYLQSYRKLKNKS